jgi:hypothetical protein
MRLIYTSIISESSIINIQDTKIKIKNLTDQEEENKILKAWGCGYFIE